MYLLLDDVGVSDGGWKATIANTLKNLSQMIETEDEMNNLPAYDIKLLYAHCPKVHKSTDVTGY